MEQGALARKTATVSLVILALGSAWLLLWYAIDLLLLIFAGLLFGVLLQTLAEGVEGRTRLSYGSSLATVLVTCGVLLVALSWLLLDSTAGQFSRLGAEIPRALEELTHAFDRSPLGRWLIGQVPALDDVDWGKIIWRNGAILPATLGTTLTVVSSILVTLFVGLYFAAQPGLYRNGLLRLVPASKRRRSAEVLHEVGTTLHWWLAGQMLAMAAIGILTMIGLRILGVDLSLALGILAALLAFIPYIGPLLSFVPAALIALLQDPSMVVWVAALYVGIQTIESYALTPLIQRKAVSVPPILTLGAQLVMGALAGPLGLLLATPLIASALPAVRMLYVEDVLGEKATAEARSTPAARLAS